MFDDTTHSVCSFDFGDEQFSSVPLPPLDRSTDFRKYGQISAGLVGGSLCLYDQTFNDQSDVWVMKKYGWPIYTRDASNPYSFFLVWYVPIHFLDNGAFLFLFHTSSSKFP